jgi:RNA recognition motif-containing protein
MSSSLLGSLSAPTAHSSSVLPSSSSPPPSSSSATLFVAEVPLEVTEAEFRSTFGVCEGYRSARLRSDRNDNTVGFVEFNDRESAAAARERLEGFKFSSNDSGITIHFAHNSRSKDKHQHYQQDSPRSLRQGVGSPSRYVNGYHRMDGYSNGRADVGSRKGVRPGLSFMPMGMQPVLSTSAAALNGTDMSGIPFYPGLGSPNLSYPSYQAYHLPADAAPTLYVEGLPLDATEREVSHIFRQMPGYLDLRIMLKESKQHPARVFNFCFVEFDNKYHATAALHHLQGYKMEKNDVKGLSISYAKTLRKERRTPS